MDIDLMFTIDPLMDHLAKELQESPGWLSLLVACNFLFFVPPVHHTAESLGLKEEATVATLLAMTLYLLGDALDTLVFPRQYDTERWAKFLASFVLPLAAWTPFLLFSRKFTWFASAGVALIFLWRLYRLARKSANNKQNEERKQDEERETGFQWLVPEALGSWQTEAKGVLGVCEGYYVISKALARKAGRYTFWRLRFPNELAKFIRSLVLPAAIVGGALPFLMHWPMPARWAALAVAVSFLLLVVYARLKARHMCRLYEVAKGIAEERQAFSNPIVEGVPLFFWKKEFVTSGTSSKVKTAVIV